MAKSKEPRFRLAVRKMYMSQPRYKFWLRLRGDWQIIDTYDNSTACMLNNFAQFQAKKALRIWNKYSAPKELV